MCTRLEFKLSARHSDDNGVESLMKFLLAFLEERKRGWSKNDEHKTSAHPASENAQFWLFFSLWSLQTSEDSHRSFE